MLKLNGGLGTSMGMTRAKSLLEIKDGLSFLDVIVRQVLDLRERHGARDSAAADEQLRHARRHAGRAAALPGAGGRGLPLDFVQGKVPKLRADDLEPVEWPADPELEWAPPGHGDVYISLATSGMLDELLERGYRYLFLSNSDNLGAVLDPRILAWFASEGLPFLSEVTDRTESDRKGGHLARRARTAGWCCARSPRRPTRTVAAFEDVERHRFFNATTSGWTCAALERTLEERDGVLGLPMIVNRKTVDPTDRRRPPSSSSRPRWGRRSACSRGRRRVRVPRSRFAPVKTTSELLVVRSDAYVLADDWTRARPTRDADPAGRARLRPLQAAGRLRGALPRRRAVAGRVRRLEVEGDVTFGRDVVVRGAVRLAGPRSVADGEVLEGS